MPGIPNDHGKNSWLIREAYTHQIDKILRTNSKPFRIPGKQENDVTVTRVRQLSSFVYSEKSLLTNWFVIELKLEITSPNK